MTHQVLQFLSYFQRIFSLNKPIPFILILMFFFAATIKAANEPNLCFHDETTFRCVEFVDNYDGDTIKFNFPGTHPLLGQDISVRLLGVDTPELRSPLKCEKLLALEAKHFVKKLFDHAKRIDILNAQRGKFFRILGDVIIDGQSVGNALLKEGLGRPYDGGTHFYQWCQD